MRKFVLVQRFKKGSNPKPNKIKTGESFIIKTAETEMIHYSCINQILKRFLKLLLCFLGKDCVPDLPVNLFVSPCIFSIHYLKV